MSMTTRCLVAFGLSVSLFAACGDDDDDGFGGGGSGGRAGGGGRGGTAGAAGAAGASGAAGAAGDAGSGGTGGSGGSAGTGGSGGSAGTGGSGTGGSGEPPDAGPDAAPDGGDEPVVDAGPEPIACEFTDDNENGIIDETEGADTSEGTQEVIFTRLTFVGPDFPDCTDANGCIQVTFRAVAEGGFAFNAPLQLCTGSEANGDCDAGVQLIDASGNGDASTALQEGEEITYVTGLGDIVTPAAGELALVNGEPAVDTDPIIRAYINWGGYTSLAATEGPNLGQSLEEAAVEEGNDGVWVLDATVAVNGQTTIYADGDITDENGFSVCTVVP
jgi:hypothetical protein